MIDVQGGYALGTFYENTVNAWPYLKSVTPATDTDKDEMPNEWENKKGLNSYFATYQYIP